MLNTKYYFITFLIAITTAIIGALIGSYSTSYFKKHEIVKAKYKQPHMATITYRIDDSHKSDIFRGGITVGFKKYHYRRFVIIIENIDSIIPYELILTLSYIDDIHFHKIWCFKPSFAKKLDGSNFEDYFNKLSIREQKSQDSVSFKINLAPVNDFRILEVVAFSEKEIKENPDVKITFPGNVKEISQDEYKKEYEKLLQEIQDME